MQIAAEAGAAAAERRTLESAGQRRGPQKRAVVDEEYPVKLSLSLGWMRIHASLQVRKPELRMSVKRRTYSGKQKAAALDA